MKYDKSISTLDFEDNIDFLEELLEKKGLTSEEYLTDSIKKSIKKSVLKEVDLKWYEKNYLKQFGKKANIEDKERLAKIEKLFPKETSRISNELVPNFNKLTKEEMLEYEDLKNRKLFFTGEQMKLEGFEKTLQREFVVEKNVRYDLHGRYMSYKNIKSDNFNVYKFKDYDFEVWVSDDSDITAKDIITTLDDLPLKLLNQNQNKIIFSSDENVYSTVHKQYVGGFANGHNNEVVIFHMKNKQNIIKSKSTIAHELGHVLDNNLGKITMQNRGYYNVAKEEGNFVTAYAKKRTC